MKGTEKQINWANDIREELVKLIDLYEEVNKNEGTYEEAKLDEMVNELREVVTGSEEASFYIDNFSEILEDRGVRLVSAYDELASTKYNKKMDIVREFAIEKDLLFGKSGAKGKRKVVKYLESLE